MAGTNATNGKPIRDDESFAHVRQLIGYSIVDVRGRKIGPVARVWTDGDSGIQQRRVDTYYGLG